MTGPEINVVGLSSGKKEGKTNWKIIGAIIGIVVLALGIIAGILLVRQQQDIREKADIILCTDPAAEQCPVAGSPNILRNCHPPEADNSPDEILCNVGGRTAFCGNKDYCCPSAGGNWTIDMSACAVVVDPEFQRTADTTITCSQGFSDYFDGIEINEANWLKYGNVYIESGKLVIKREKAGTTAGANNYDGVVTKNSLTGDFVVEVDIDEVIKEGSGGGIGAILFLTEDLDTDRFVVARGIKLGQYVLSAIGSIGPIQDGNEIALSEGPVAIKVERKSGIFSAYYKDSVSSEYKLLYKSPRALSKTIQRIDLSVLNTGLNSSTTVKFDNFKISCTADGPTSTATATSTSTSNPTPTTTATATSTATSTSGSKTATPTATSTSGIGGGGATATATSKATATSSSVPIPVTGANWPTIIGTGFGILMILSSFILAL